MLVATTHLGHREDPGIATRLADTDPHRVVLSDTDRQRSRVRTETADGTEIGIVVATDLADGDVLETDAGDLVIVDLEAVDALVLDLSSADVRPLVALELGHTLGNRHWDLAVRDGRALFPVPDTRERMREAVTDELPEGIEPRFEAVPPTVFDDGEHGTTATPTPTAATPTNTTTRAAIATIPAPVTEGSMTDEGPAAATLAAFRLADSFLPVGAYTASYGLEQFVQDGRVADGDELEALLRTYLRRQVGPSDLVALRAAHRAALAGDLGGVGAADQRLTAVTLAAEFRDSAEQSGQRLLALQQEVREPALLDRYADRVEAGDAPGNYPVVLGVATALAGIDEQEACLLCCHGFVTGLLGAAQRVLSLGHTEAQRILVALHPVMTAAVEDSAGRSLDDLSPFAPLVDVLAADHERANRRLFRS